MIEFSNMYPEKNSNKNSRDYKMLKKKKNYGKVFTIPSPHEAVDATPINPAEVTNGPPTSVVHIIFTVHNVVDESGQLTPLWLATVSVLKNLSTEFGSLSAVIGPHPATYREITVSIVNNL